MSFLLFAFSQIAIAATGVRVVSSTSCEIIPVNLGIGMTTQIVLEQEPKVTLYADKKHFKVNTNRFSPRSLAIIPFVDPAELNLFKDSTGRFPSPQILATALDRSFETNLFVFFENNNQLMFKLRFVKKKDADYVLKVTQDFSKECNL